jgi:2-polyprenyl-3-methyl-5-hydroxy-6-metoxy-1,4-benzoquinol methylase
VQAAHISFSLPCVLNLAARVQMVCRKGIGVPLNKLRERLFERYDTHYLRGNSTDYQRYMPDYEACYGRVVAELPKGSRLLDLGCGIGFLLFWLERSRPGLFQLAGVDMSEPQLTLAKENLPAVVTLVREEATMFLERNPNQFAAVFCTHMLEHIETDDELLRLLELAKTSLVPGGLFICEVPNMANLTGVHSRYIDLTHTRGFTELSLLQLLECVSFRECQIMNRKAADASQWVRMSIENLIHRAIYRICGVGNERHFCVTIIGIGKA